MEITYPSYAQENGKYGRGEQHEAGPIKLA